MSSPFDRYGAVLTIDLAALSTNFRTLAAQAASGGAQVAAVVKADAYGLGIAQVAPTLAAAGCTRFFVAMPEEGLTLRGLLPDVEIFVLSGPLGNGAEVEDCAALAAANLMPILNSPGQISRWRALQDQLGRTAAAGLHVDTGMNRLGLAHTDLIRLEERGQLGAGLDLRLIMSHLACADEAAHPLNQAQLGRFQGARALLPEIPASLAASFGTFLGNDFLFDWVRPGAALYGINPRP